MTGYQETMTDPSYHRQIVVATAPQIGNTGWNDEDDESRGSRIWVAGLVIRDLSAQVSSWRATRSLEDEMIAQNIIGIAGVDTRTIVRHLRNFGSISAGIFSGEAADQPVEKLIETVRSQPAMAGLDLAEQVSTTEPYIVEPIGEHKFTVVAYDMGIKTNTPRNFVQRGIRTIVVPAPGAARMGAGPVEGEALLRWAEVLLRAVVEGDPAYETEATAYRRRR